MRCRRYCPSVVGIRSVVSLHERPLVQSQRRPVWYCVVDSACLLHDELPSSIKPLLKALSSAFTSGIINDNLFRQLAKFGFGVCSFFFGSASLFFNKIKDTLSAVDFALRVLELYLVQSELFIGFVRLLLSHKSCLVDFRQMLSILLQLPFRFVCPAFLSIGTSFVQIQLLLDLIDHLL